MSILEMETPLGATDGCAVGKTRSTAPLKAGSLAILTPHCLHRSKSPPAITQLPSCWRLHRPPAGRKRPKSQRWQPPWPETAWGRSARERHAEAAQAATANPAQTDRPTCFWRKSLDSPQFSRCLAMTGFFHHAGHGDHRGGGRRYIHRCSVDSVSSAVNFNHIWPFDST
jgi:hypothetical protein